MAASSVAENKSDGSNLCVNDGAAARQTLLHLHGYVVPR